MSGAHPELKRPASPEKTGVETWEAIAVQLLEHLESERATGLARISSGGKRVGSLVSLDGRVCLAARSGPSTLFRTNPSVLHLARQARDAGERFSEIVFQQSSSLAGDVRADVLNRAGRGLREVAEACVGAERKVHLVPASNDYDRRLSYGAAEILAAAAGPREVPSSELARAVFERIRGTADGALLFELEEPAGRPSLPLDHFGMADISLRELRALLRASREILQPTADPGSSGWDTVRWCVLRSRRVPWVLVKGDTCLALARCGQANQVGLVLGRATYTASQRPNPAH